MTGWKVTSHPVGGVNLKVEQSVSYKIEKKQPPKAESSCSGMAAFCSEIIVNCHYL